ncbi:MAG: type II toxin-antitoxin system RelE/ParE family toxin [Pseudomonadota bacterium]
MIKSFKNKETEKLFNGERCRLPYGIHITAQRKLRSIHAANDLSELRALPGNRIEALKGNREGQHSMRINDQWRICFVWTGEDAYDVEIVDYH